MKIKKVYAVYFSATGTTKKIAEYIADNISKKLNIDLNIIDFTPKEKREETFDFKEDELAVFATPVYAGRVPNVLLPFLKYNIKGNNALCVPVVLFGNRNYDDALIELRDIMEENNFHSIAAGAFVGEHSFSNFLAKNRPDSEDLKVADELIALIIDRIGSLDTYTKEPINVKGQTPIRPYYTPRDRNDNKIDIRKVLPKVDHRCNDCKLCAEVCPMGSIDKDDIRKYNGICIKCGACIKKCPMNARYYDDEGYLYHKKELEEMYARRAEDEIF
ncbi:EFR1 family ferrodoxin [Anaerofustis stercorihominis]|uniref:Ferredoxin n=1 Tax=Anaerofustis stercorihominis TaxID=214853 RepID=A0A3E3E0L3_9FIRM|nr:EFR1 family ferrodoxin [Anaerofustis stercorihominis]RGD75104.1 ferredoxin [Anaerofustis stercorihominis]